RRARAHELNSRYFLDGAGYCKSAEEEMAMPDLFALLEADADIIHKEPAA
ncbi:hypothetical protein GHV90_15175, partial [Pseudomonas aeruginosa]|nr:hypothetical protein [Pseudomonas aeruginosa]MBG7227523.1 hypothetical protein [Pseudomonas aeruginosa]